MSCKRHTKADVRYVEITTVQAVRGEYDETTMIDIWCPICGKVFTQKGYDQLPAGDPDKRTIVFDDGTMKRAI